MTLGRRRFAGVPQAYATALLNPVKLHFISCWKEMKTSCGRSLRTPPTVFRYRLLRAISERLHHVVEPCDALHPEFGEHDLAVPQWIALSALWRQDGLTVTAIARYTKATVPAASRLIDRMVEQGLLERKTREGDRRVVEIWLTPKAQSTSGLVYLFRDVNERILEGFSDQEIERMAGYLERITTNASRHYAERKPDDPLVV